jgi:hypothetical protein
LIFAGHEITMGFRVPPKWLAICLVHWNGVHMACAHALGTWLKYFGPPSSLMALRLSCHFSGKPLKNRFSLIEPSIPPSALAPLSPTM